MSKRCELQKEYYKQFGNYKGNGKYCDKYVIWLENEILALRQPPVSGRSEQCLHTERVWTIDPYDQKCFKCVKCGKYGV